MLLKSSIFMIIIWDAFKTYFDLHNPVIQFAILAPVIAFGSFQVLYAESVKKIFFFPLVIWNIWILYALLNTFFINDFNPHIDTSYTIFISSIILVPIFILQISSKKITTNSLYNTVIFALFFRMFLSIIFDSFDALGRDTFERFGSDFNANAIAAGALYAFILSIIRSELTKYNKIDIFVILFSLFFLIITASVKFAFAAFMFWTLSRVKNLIIRPTVSKTTKTVFGTVLLSLILAVYIPHTNLAGRIMDKLQNSLNAKQQEQLFDNRAAQYILGWEAFKDNPVNGIGLRNFVFYSGNTAPLHSEYLVQITECGLIGLFLFISFYFYVLYTLLRLFKLYKNHIGPEIFLNICSILIMLYLFFGIWNYNIVINWILIAFSLRSIYTYKSKSKQRLYYTN